VAAATAAGAPLVLLDTDLLSTAVYSRHYYGECPAWIDEAARRRRGELYLLHEVDVEWQADGFQREAPERREELFDRFAAALDAIGARVEPVRGPWEERRRRAQQAISRLLAEDARPGR
jgi:nicotinamide riboside kinase